MTFCLKSVKLPWNVIFPVRHLSIMLCWALLCLPALGQEAETTISAAEEEPAAIILNPGEPVPPFVQLHPDEPAVIWNANEVAEFNLLDQDGNPVTRESMLGKPWIANFIFSRCAYQCPMTCRRMMELNEEVRDVDLRIFTLTVDPEHDNVAIMKSYAEIWKATPDRWLFVTGEPDDVWKLIREGFKVAAWENAGTARQPGMEFAHSNHILHIDENGNILGRYDSGIDSEMVTLTRVLKGQIETPEKFKPATINSLEELVQGEDPFDKLPEWAKRLPATNAMLNTLSTLLLIMGYFAIKTGNVAVHKKAMLIAFGVSVVFLIGYLSYHYALHHYLGIRGKPFEGTGVLRPIYYSILISHVVLAALVPVLTIVTIVKGLKENWPSHKRWAKVTFPIWLYVSVTGVIIYLMLYHIA